MERGTKNAIRLLLVLALLVSTGAVAFAAGFGLSMVAESRGLLPRPTPDVMVPPDTQEPTPSAPDPTTSPQPSPTPVPGPEGETFQLFWEVWGLVEDNYYGDLPDMQSVTYGAIRGMLDTLDDDYTAFVEPQIADIIREDATGSFEGIGAFVRMREDGKLEIASLISGQPAEAAGLEDGDRILAVDGRSIIGFGIYEAIALIRGPAGTDVTLLVERTGVEEPFEVTVTRARIEIPLVESRIVRDNVAYISLREFSTTADAQMAEALQGLLVQEPTGLVFDLRDNPGGWLDQAVSVADLFLDEGVILIERSSDGREELFESEDGDIAETIPLVVLVNEGSASASEIVAGAIQARDRGILVGLTTFGKGSVQRPYRLSDGSELRVTVARWFTPADQAIHGQGLIPDIEIPLPEDLEPGQDPQLERAIDHLLNGE
jgi:carboxyl-terminal processing protease